MSDLHDVIYLHPVTAYNDATTGSPSRTYTTPGTKIYAKVRRTLGTRQDGDKTQTINTWTLTVRRDTTAYKADDRITWANNNTIIRSIKDIDHFFQEITCENEI